MDKDLSQQELLEIILDFRKEREWEQFHDLKNIAISLNLEAAEVLELFQWTKDNDIQTGKKSELADELADVYYWVLLMAHDADININKALAKKMEKNVKKYPAHKSKGKSTKYSKL